MPDYTWPKPDQRKYIGTRVSRVDGPEKVSGRAQYTFDLVRPGMLYGKILGSPHARARVVSVDTTAAEKMPGVKAVHLIAQPGATVNWAGAEIVAVAAETEQQAEDAVRAVVVKYEPLPYNVVDRERPPKDIPPDTGPLMPADLQDMISNQVPDRQMLEALQQRGIGFEPQEQQMAAAARAGVSQRVIDAIKAAPRKQAESRPASWFKPQAQDMKGEPDKAFAEAAAVSQGMYGLPVITHCCLESHGAISEWTDDQHLLVYISTQNVSGMPGQFAGPLSIDAANVRVHQDHIGGGFGSKFGADRWGIASAQLSKKAGGRPVKIMLDRAQELEFAGARPSCYADVKVAADKDGNLTAWESYGWGTGGPGGGNSPPLPYIFDAPNQRKQYVAVVNNIGPARAWRAPSHPQAAIVTMCALDDLAAKLNMNPLAFFQKNIALTGTRQQHLPQVYTEELKIADELMGWNQRWRPRGSSTGVTKQGLGLSIHTWGGRGHESNCDLTIHPDGSVEIKMGTQDLGTGTRTAILMVAADTLGINLDQIKLLIGDSAYPQSGGSGGSTTIGGVSSSTRRGAVDARDQLFAKVAPALNAKPEELEAREGVVRVVADPKRSLDWKDACAKLGAVGITARGKNPGEGNLISSGVGGVQMADVSVDTETGIVRVNKMVCVQDCGLVIDLKTAESQCYGAMIMGITYALYEEKVMDQSTGRMLNPNMEFYRLAGIGDIGELVVRMMQTPYHEGRGVIGLGEPPVISPGAAISNAVANALGVRVPFLPLTPDRVLDALEKKGGAA